MIDQAHDLRRLVRHAAAAATGASRGRPPVVVVAGGKGGVGTSTVAIRLAAAATANAVRSLLIDADPRGGSIAVLCGLEEQGTLADVLAGRHSIQEVIQQGPDGTRVVPGACPSDALWEAAPAAADRLLDQISAVQRQADLVIIDAGNGLCRLTGPLVQAADILLLVTTPAVPAIVATYGLIRGLASMGAVLPVHILVNMASSAEAAQGALDRLICTCRRLLGWEPARAGSLPVDPSALDKAVRAAAPLRSLAAHAMAIAGHDGIRTQGAKQQFYKKTGETLNLETLPVDIG